MLKKADVEKQDGGEKDAAVRFVAVSHIDFVAYPAARALRPKVTPRAPPPTP